MKDSKDAKIGLYYMVFSSFCVAITTAIAKVLSHRLSPMELVFFRNIFGVIYVLFLIYRKPLKNIGGKPFLLFFRGFGGISHSFQFLHCHSSRSCRSHHLSAVLSHLFSLDFNCFLETKNE